MRSIALAATLVALSACPAPEPVEETRDPVVDLTPEPAALTGTYQVTSQFEVPATVVAPGPLGDSLEFLRQLSVNPAGALLDFAAGGPALDALRAVLPISLEGELEGWMNGYLNSSTVHGTSPHARIVALDEQVRSVLLDWDLRSTLDLPASGTGTHSPIALVFSAAGDPIVVPVDASAPVTAATDVTAIVSWPAAGATPNVTIGDHAMGIPFGHYALTAIDAVMERQLGASGVRAALDQIVDCAGMAASVADRCVGVGIAKVCVGNEGTLADVCADGLDAAASRIEAQILSIDYQAIRFISGAATVDGVARDEESGTATATALSSGAWTSIIDLQQVPQEATATFTAAR